MGLGVCLPSHAGGSGEKVVLSKRCWSADDAVQAVDVASGQLKTCAQSGQRSRKQ